MFIGMLAANASSTGNRLVKLAEVSYAKILLDISVAMFRK